jgi:ATP-dependent DNA helicase RecG
MLTLCSIPKSGGEIMEHLGISDRKHLRDAYIHPAIGAGLLAMTLPDKPNSSKQKYIITDKGKTTLDTKE